MSSFSIFQTQQHCWSLVNRSYHAGRLGAAYLVCGPEGYGHWPFVLGVTALLNCEQVKTNASKDPCGECRSCRLIATANFEGLHVIAPIKSHKKTDEAIELTAEFIEERRKEPYALLDTSSPVTIPIDMARELKRNLAQRANPGIRRVAAIYRIDRMKAEGTDSLLKLVEEPPSDTTLLLTTINPESVSPTIMSRCRAVHLGPVPEPYVVDYLVTRYKLTAEKAKLLARIADNDLGRAISLARVEDDDLSDRAVGFLLFKSLFAQSAPSMIGHLTEFMAEADRGQAEELIRLWGSLVRDCNVYAATGSDDDLVNIDFAVDLRRLSSRFSNPEVAITTTRELKNTLADLRRNVHIHPTLAALALRLHSTLTPSV